MDTVCRENLPLVFIITLALICRTKDHMRHHEDFYELASSCMKQTANGTQPSVDNKIPNDYRQNLLQQQQMQQRQPHSQQNQQQHHRRPENILNQNNYNNIDQYRDNRYGTNKDTKHPIFDYDHGVLGEQFRNLPNTCTCISQEGYVHRYGFNGRRYKRKTPYSSPHYVKRDAINYQAAKNYIRKNFTSIPVRQTSPLEEINSCVIHCIFREMKMLNNENKPDKQAMITIMTQRIQNPELKEFIQESVEECFEFTDTDNREEQCESSKKLILCLEEKTKRGCDDWESRENSIQKNNFNFTHLQRNSREDVHQYNNVANQNVPNVRNIGSNSHKNRFNNV